MKAPQIVFKTLIGVILVSFIIAGCKKKEEEQTPAAVNKNPAPAAETSQQTKRSSDQTDLENESNHAMDDANAAMGEVSTTRDIQTTCGMTYDSSTTATTGIIILTYDGTVCSGVKREGTITIHLPVQNGHVVHFSTANVTASLVFDNYKVTKVATNKSMTFTGTHLVRNENAGGWFALLFLGTPIIHHVRAHVHVVFEDSTECEWNAAVKRTFSNTNSVIKASIAKDTVGFSFNGTTYNDAAFWGTNRLGEEYVIEMSPFTYDIVNSNNCTLKPLTGTFKFHWSSYLLTLTYGVNSDGTAATSCPYGYKFNWTDVNGNANEVVLPY
jgi:hypothetical protein